MASKYLEEIKTLIQEGKTPQEIQQKLNLTPFQYGGVMSHAPKYFLVPSTDFTNKFRIICYKDIYTEGRKKVNQKPALKRGQLGGLVSGPGNLSQDGLCWIDESSQVTGTAKISGSVHILRESYIRSGNIFGHYGSTLKHCSISFNMTVNARIGTAQLTEVRMLSYGTNDDAITIDIPDGYIDDTALHRGAVVEGYVNIKRCTIRQAKVKSIKAIDCHFDDGCNVSTKQNLRGISFKPGAVVTDDQRILGAMCDSDLSDLRKSIMFQTGLMADSSGDIICYKLVNKDMTSLRTKEFKYHLGLVTTGINITDYVKRNGELSKVSCGPGLHFSHATYWLENEKSHSQRMMLICRVNLRNIIAVQEGKIRATKCYVLDAVPFNGPIVAKKAKK